MCSQLGVSRELLVTVSTWVDGSTGMVSHVHTQLVEVEERFVTLCTCVLLLLMLLRHVQSAYIPLHSLAHTNIYSQHH